VFLQIVASGPKTLSGLSGLGPNFAHLDGGTIKRKFNSRKYGTF
jgi:hypothetical protein